MRKLKTLICALCLLSLVPLLLQAARTLPLDTRPLVAEKYAGWSGVLRLWVFEGWPCGISSWLNRCISRFEKGHPGVYVQPAAVDADALRSLNDSGILPPDMILFPPGLLETPRGLLPLAPPDGLRAPLARCGDWNGTTYAVPVALGGYLWAINTSIIDAVPDSWREARVAPAVPVPEDWRRWDGALLSLCSGRHRTEEAPADTDGAPMGIDLGLTLEETPAPTAPPAPLSSAALPCRLPEDFQFDGDAWRRFINGEAAAIPVTQREVRRLQALSAQGKGPDWRLSRGDAAFTDQLLFIGIVDRESSEAQRALCRELIDWLLSEDCQRELHCCNAFSVTNAPSGYEGADPLLTMDSLLRDAGLRVPRCFDGQWFQVLERNVRDFIADLDDSSTLWGRFGEALSKNPNI